MIDERKGKFGVDLRILLNKDCQMKIDSWLLLQDFQTAQTKFLDIMVVLFDK